MNETERLILESCELILKKGDYNMVDVERAKQLREKIRKILLLKEDDGLAEQRDKDLEEGSLNAKKTEESNGTRI